jgi:hypothetical protein
LSEKSTKKHPLDSQNALTARDLVIALGWHAHFAGADNELAKYWHLRFELLGLALGLPSDWSEDRGKTSYMLRPLAEEVIHDGFFAQFLV